MRRRKKLITQKIIKQGIVDYTSNILLKIGSNFLTFFHIPGNIPFLNDSSNILFRGIVTDSLLIEISSHPCDLLESSDNTKIIYSDFDPI